MSVAATLRADAAKRVFAVLENRQSLRDTPANANLSQKDKAWSQEMVLGVMRQLPILQVWLRQLLDKPLKNKQKVIESLIIIGFYQIAFSRVSTHAAVAETVEACRLLGSPGLKGLVNGVLRNFIRQELSEKKSDNPQINSGLPKWIYKKLVSQPHINLDQVIAAISQKPPLWLRINATKTSRETYTQLLDEQSIDYTLPTNHPQGIVLSKSTDVTQLPKFEEGWFAVQDGAAQLAAQFIAPQAGDRILDACAAPGGKTCHILETQQDLKECIALDSDSKRLVRVSENLERLSLSAKIIAADASQLADWWDGTPFDRILLDAPCSATGVIRRHPDIKWLRKRADIDVLVDLQRTILNTLWQALKPDGILLYATCSILQEENTLQIAQFLNEQADAELVPILDTESTSSPGWQIMPGEQGMDGFYYARLKKVVRA
jgi:16S rRNA (cytosine967-C5)-methyltransferase